MKRNETPSTEEMVKGVLRYINDPVPFVHNVLRAVPDPWQEEALRGVAANPRTAIRAGHGVGKTAFESWLICWFNFTRPYPKIPCTAPTQQQLYDILWAEVSKWMQRSPLLDSIFEWQKTKIVNRAFPERWFATARTASKPENMAGFHEEHLLFLCDEASGISDGIYETIEGALTTADAKLVMCGNPTRNSGTFKRAFFEDRALYFGMKVSCMDSPRVIPEYAQRLIKRYGIDSDVVRVRVLGEFPKSEPDGFIPLELIEAAFMREIEPDPDLMLHVGADIARFGDDETVVVPRIGGRMLGMHQYTRQDTMKTTGDILNITKANMAEYKKPQATINVDDDGVGGGVTDRLREIIREDNLNIDVIDCHNGGTPQDTEHFHDWITEAWDGFRERLRGGDIELINDEDLVAQLSSRKYSLNSRGQIILEPKKEFKKRIKRSPDRADAVILAFAENTKSRAINPAIAAVLGGARIYGH